MSKMDLVAPFRDLASRGQIGIATDAPGSENLKQELMQFVVKPGKRAPKLEAKTGHDDLVISLCLAVWAASQAFWNERGILNSFGYSIGP